MTETEWLTSDDPHAMLAHLGEQISDRKLWLFGCACCRRIWPALLDERSRAVVELRERLDHGLTSDEEVRAACVAARKAITDSSAKAMDGLDFEAIMGPDSPWERRALPGGELDRAGLGRLADALEQAGCTERAILNHLRGPGPHVRGCWAVDLVLAGE
jgi:hypothetical protein